MFRFLLGLLAGLSLSYALRRVKTDKYNQDRIDLYYQRRAKSYQLTDQWVQFGGNAPRIEMRIKTCQHVDLKAGDRVLDIACGTGANFPYIQERIGPTGSIVGFDFSEAMLAEAQKQIDEQGWTNVELAQGDAAALDLGEQFDVVICVLGMVVIPDYQAAMERAFAHVKPGGRFAIADLCENGRWYMQPVNFLMDALDATLITDTSRRPWEIMEPWVAEYQREELLFGYMYVASGRKPL